MLGNSILPKKSILLRSRGFASAEATKGHENRRMSAGGLWKPSAPLLLGLFAVDFIRFLDKHAGVA